MIRDILTMLWKEFREMFLQGPRLRGGWFGLLIFIGVFGILLPLQTGRQWIESPTSLLVWAWVPFILVNSVVADSFAGERERHTLETLLASRLSDTAILFGKLVTAVAYGWGMALLGLILSLVTVNVAFGEGQVLMYSPLQAFAVLLLSLLVALLAGALGVIVSLRASSVQQAQQTLSMAMFAVLIPLLLLPMLPQEWQVRVMRATSGMDLEAILGWFTLLLLVVDAGLITYAMSRFRRSRLILD